MDSLSGCLFHGRVCQTFHIRTQRETTDKFCKYKAKQIFIFPASLRSLPDTLGLQAEDGCPNIAEEQL
ncbi:hypothetical protein I79_000416 [Cricetulus griseus]|uniref:Uncharacterized protein n=1 Tax=Cricetulus griseus TaxID=10029 RepID=G3GS99_CRIGR|nr:hypothetical protein I79_000416 [Cricetulus griseus]